MAVSKYKVWAFGSKVGTGVTDSFHIGVHGIAKTNSTAAHNIVVNEFVANKLAQAILLNTPPGFIIEKDSNPYFVSLNFNLAGHDLPPADAEDIVINHPKLANGIILFDEWIMNYDRHAGNIYYDKTMDVVQIFDHSHALFPYDDIRTNLEANKDKSQLGGHCLAPFIDSLDGLMEWNDRITQIPEFYIKEVIYSFVELGLDDSIKDFCIDFILDRRKNLIKILKDFKKTFPNIKDDEWDKL